MKRIAPLSRSTTCAATAGSSASAATPPARGATPTASRAPTRARARRVCRRKSGETGADELLQRLRNRRAARAGRRPRRAHAASSSAKNGFPPDCSWMRSSVWRANGLPKRSWRSRCSAPTLSGPTRSRSTRSRRLLQPDGSARRAAGRAAARRAPRGVAARTRARSPTRRRATGRRRSRRRPASLAEQCSTSRTATASARWSTVVRGLVAQERHLQRAPSRRGQLGITSSRTPSKRSPSPTWARPALGLRRTRREDDAAPPARRR